MRLYGFTLAFTVIAALHTVIPTQAEAASALFRAKRSWIGGDPTSTTTVSNRYVSPDYHPRTMGPSSAPPGTAYIASGTMGGNAFTIPSSVIKDIGGTRTCFPFGCNTWQNSAVSNSYWNAKGSFRPNNPYGATTPTTIVFPTTMGNPVPHLATGDPVTPTATFSGHYDFSRSGAIRITPGANRFGGTMKFLTGPGQRSYRYTHQLIQKLARYYSYSSSQPTDMHQTHPGDFSVGPHGYGHFTERFRTISGGGFSTMYPFDLRVISTVAPWTTGQLTVSYIRTLPYLSVGGWVTWGSTRNITVTNAGYDNRTPSGLNGVISMVRPRLVHTYLSGRGKLRSFAEIWQIDIHFLPEPRSSVLLISGVAALCGVYGVRRRWSKPPIVSAVSRNKANEEQ